MCPSAKNIKFQLDPKEKFYYPTPLMVTVIHLVGSFSSAMWT